MPIARALAVATAVVSVALGLAGPARAEQVPQGIYTNTQGDVHAEWTISPSCVSTVGDLRDNLELPVACRPHIAPAPTTVVSGGDARLVGGDSEFSTNIKDGLQCADGSTGPIQETYRFDDTTMTGTREKVGP